MMEESEEGRKESRLRLTDTEVYCVSRNVNPTRCIWRH